jgi:cysteine synthase A
MSKDTKISDCIGDTPLLHISGNIYAKAEFMNPTGSIKDRMASFIINDAEEKGLLKKGDTIIEATSGNAGISFAWLAAERGYNIKIVMPNNMSDERKQILRFYGADLIEVDAGDFDQAIDLRDKLAKENSWFNTNQFGNPLNIQAHELGTAQEIREQAVNGYKVIGGSNTIAALIAGTGTGGTLMGCRKTLAHPLWFPNMKTIAVEPAESPVMSGGKAGLHGIQGIGDGSKFLVDMDLVDEVIQIKTSDAKKRACALAKEKGLFVGISSGANILAAERWAEDNPDVEGNIITFLCDRGGRYFSCLES